MPGKSTENFKSEWILLAKDAYYPIESWHLNDGTTEGHLSVAVEFEKPNTAGHHHTLKDIQVLAIHP